MIAKPERKIPELDKLRKEQKDFFTKYSNQLKKFNLKIVKKAIGLLKEEELEDTLSCYDLEAYEEEMLSYQSSLEDEPKKTHEAFIKPKEVNIPYKKFSKTLYSFLRGKIRKHLLRVYHGSLRFEASIKMNKDDEDIIVYSYKKWISIEEEFIKDCLMTCKKQYRELYTVLKKRGTNNE